MEYYSNIQSDLLVQGYNQNKDVPKKDFSEKKQLKNPHKDKVIYNSMSIKNSIKDTEIAK